MRSDLGLGFVVTSLSIDYLKPAYLDDRLTVTTEIALVRPASVNFNQTVAREDQILANLKVRVACLDADGNPVRLPTALTTTP
jgi:acyl-CoA thioester hydrolase